MITEMEKIDFILKEGAKKGVTLSKFVKLQIEEFKNSNEYKEMIIGGKYYKNQGDIAKKERTYIDDRYEGGVERVVPHAKNYQLKHPILYKMINQKAGYLARSKPTINQIIDDGEKEDKKYKKILKDIFNNKMHKRLKYTVIEAVKRGISWWQIYVDKNGDLKVRLRYATRIVPIWEDEEHEVLSALIMFYDVQKYENDGLTTKTVTKVEYYDEDGIRYYIYDANNLIEDVEEVEKRKDYIISRDTEGTSVLGHFRINEKVGIFKKGIPFIYFKYNGDELPLIHFLKSLLDCYDELCSKIGDTIYEAPDGINIVEGYESDQLWTFKKNLYTFGTVFLDEGATYDRKEIQINIEAFKTFIEQLRKDIYEGGFGVDTQSEKFGTQESGVALKQLYADLDLDCSNIETEFKSSLEYFKAFFDEWLILKDGADYSETEVEFVFNKTMTVNEKELIENCKNSIGIISNATIRAKHPFVTDVESEEEKMQKEKAQEKEDDYEKVMPTKKVVDNNEK